MEVSTSCHISFAVLVGILQYVRINYNTFLFSEFLYQKGITRIGCSEIPKMRETSIVKKQKLKLGWLLQDEIT